MLSDLMITRQVARFSLRLLALQALALLLPAAACQRVPLLAPANSTITVTAAATTLPLNGTTDIIAQVLEPAGTPPHDGTLITFTTTLGSVQPPEAETSGGRVIVKFNAGTSSGTATITATSGGATGTSTTGGAAGATTPSNAVRIAIGAAAVGRIVVGANPGTVLAAGGSSTITANVADPNGNALAGVPVTFTTDLGSLSAAVVNTDQNGNAQTRLTTSKTSKVTATAGLAGSGSGTTATTAASATITINVNTPPGITVGAASPASPSVGQSVTFPLTYASDANGSPIQSVTVNFGDGSPATTYQGKPASVSHTYAAMGSYTILATTVDALGDTSSASGSVNVALLLTLAITPPAAPSAGLPASFTIVPGVPPNTGVAVRNVRVDWGDNTPAQDLGAISASTTVSHVFELAGSYRVTGTLTDTAGSSISVSTFVTVIPVALPTINITPSVPAIYSPSMNVTFTIQVTPPSGVGIKNVTINFGDGSTDGLGGLNGTLVKVHTYTAPTGTPFNITVTVEDTLGTPGRITTGTTSIKLP